MRVRRIVAALFFVPLAACGGDDTTTPAPTGTHEITGRIMGPVGDAQDTVDRLNERQQRSDDGSP